MVFSLFLFYYKNWQIIAIINYILIHVKYTRCPKFTLFFKDKVTSVLIPWLQIRAWFSPWGNVSGLCPDHLCWLLGPPWKSSRRSPWKKSKSVSVSVAFLIAMTRYPMDTVEKRKGLFGLQVARDRIQNVRSAMAKERELAGYSTPTARKLRGWTFVLCCRFPFYLAQGSSPMV